jgi:hypothetical protein
MDPILPERIKGMPGKFVTGEVYFGVVVFVGVGNGTYFNMIHLFSWLIVL